MDLPTIYQFKGDPEKYMIGSEVGSRLNLFKGALYKRFPKLWRRVITKEEKKTLAELGVHNRVLANWEIMFIKATDGEAILRGGGKELKGPRPRMGPQVCQNKLPRPPQSGPQTHQIHPSKLIKGSNAEIHLGPLLKSEKGLPKRQVCQIWRKRRRHLRRRLLPVT